MTTKPLLLLSLAAALLFSQDMHAVSDSLFVYLPGGRIDVYPSSVIQRQETDELQTVVVTIDGKTHIYQQSQLDSISHRAPQDMPTLTSFKFNNKYNGQVFTDVLCDIGPDGLITGSVPAIGKWLTPSFQRSDDAAEVYVGRTLQRSKVSRLSFAQPVDYVVTRPGWQVMMLTHSSDSEPEPEEPEAEYTTQQIPLTGDMLSTNAPTMRANEDLPMMLDGDDATFFHSTWSGSGYDVLPLDSCPWIEITLPEAVHNLQFRYETRQADNRWPVALRLDGSADGQTWKPLRTFTAEDGLPQGSLQWWTSPAMDLGADYAHLRLVCTAAAYKNYFCVAELELYSVTFAQVPEPQPTLPAGDRLDWQPFGTRYTVSIDWPTDRAVDVPSIYITTDAGILPPDKYNYLDGTFSIDGAGVFPDMEPTPMQIRGRGNSSWAGQFGKSPYRLKFPSKVKPFGLTAGKSWVLLANSIGGSMMSNAIGMKVAQMAGTAGANHIVPVNLYINGEYRGSYNLTEQTGFHNNSIDLPDETYATLLELDTYTDETIYRANYFRVPVKIKEPEFEEPETVTPLTPDDIMADFNELLSAAVDGEDISRWVQIDTFAAFYLTNDLILNQELMHPKSTYLYKERVGEAASPWKFGPVWDLDWGFGHELNSGYFTTGATSDLINAKSMECNGLWRALTTAGETFPRTYYKAWTRFLRQGGVQELVDYCREYYEYAEPSFAQNASRWGDGRNYANQVPQQQAWLQKRADFIYRRLTPYDLSEDLPEDPDWKPYTDAQDIDPLDLTPYTRVRTAVENILASEDAYSVPTPDVNAVRAAINEQNSAVQRASADADVQRAAAALRAAFFEFLCSDGLTILQPLDLTDILLQNPSPVENADGWTCSQQPATFDTTHRIAEFINQPGATIKQTIALPAGQYVFGATAFTRAGYTAHLLAAGQQQKLPTVSRALVNDLASARQWIDKGNGTSSIAFGLTRDGIAELGLQASSGSGDSWTAWSDFHLTITGKPVKPTVSEQQFLAANAAIEDGTPYRIFTLYDGSQFGTTRYYLGRDGYLTTELRDADVYVFSSVRQEESNEQLYASPAWKTDAYFTNPRLSQDSSGDIVPHGFIRTDTQLARDNWEGQVWYLQDERFAVRATNSPAGTWGAETFWFVEDIDSDGTPEAGYSWGPYFLWQLQAVKDGIADLPAPAPTDSAATLPTYDLAGRRISRPARPGIYVRAGRKVVVK